MIPPLAVWCVAAIAQQAAAPIQFTEVVPAAAAEHSWIRSPGKTRAVVVIQGYTLHLTERGAATVKWHSYQHADSPLVKLLARDADVFALAYGQTLPVSAYASQPALRQELAFLRKLGYQEIVLVGFSAGGLIARQFVEDQPDSGVTKVIQVDSPNLGTNWAVGTRDPFRHSLTAEARKGFLRQRPGKRIPDSVQFVCVVGTGLLEGDGVVSIRSQWPEDLQAQGIPVRTLRTTHLKAARSQSSVQLIAELVQKDLPRWDVVEVLRMRQKLAN